MSTSSPPPPPPPPPPPSFPPGYLEENNGCRVYAVCTIMLVLTSVLFPLRLYARSLTSVRRGWDDHILIPAYIFFLGLVASVYAEVRQAGLGRHAAAVQLEDPGMITTYLLLLYVLDWFYVPSNMLSRVSVVFLYLRILTGRRERAASWAVMAFLVANCAATVVAAQLECAPLAFAWDKTVAGGRCFDQVLWYQLSNFPNIAADVMIALLPVRTVWGLKASAARKAGIAVVCLMGSIGLIASCVRTSVFYSQADVIRTDPTFADEAFSWTVVECGMYFSAACLIGMRPLLNPLLERLPSALRAHFPYPSGRTADSTFGPDASDKLPMHRRPGAPHAGAPEQEEAGDDDLEAGPRRAAPPPGGRSDVSLPLPLHHPRGHSRTRVVVPGDDLGKEIPVVVETSVEWEVRRDRVRSPSRRRMWEPRETPGVYVYSGQVHNI